MDRVRRRLERSSERIVTTDGVQAFYGQGWLWIQPSATESLCRIAAESDSRADAESMMEQGVTLVRELEAALGTPDGLSELWCDSA